MIRMWCDGAQRSASEMVPDGPCPDEVATMPMGLVQDSAWGGIAARCMPLLCAGTRGVDVHKCTMTAGTCAAHHSLTPFSSKKMGRGVCWNPTCEQD